MYLFTATSSIARLGENYTALKQGFGTPLALNVGKSGPYWSNGCVTRFFSSKPVYAWKQYLTDALKGATQFWLLHDGAGRAIDNMSEGPGTMNLKNIGSTSICQLFLRYNETDDMKTRRVSALMDRLREGKVICKYAFDFSNGGIYFLASQQDSKTIFRRCEAALRYSIEFVFVDPNGVTYSFPEGELDDDESWTKLEVPIDPLSLFA
jgi:hypothetical protein